MGAEKEKMNIRIIILRILSILSVNAFAYSGFLLLRAAIFNDDGGAEAIALYAVIMCFAHVTGRLLASANHTIINKIVRTKFVRFLSFMMNIRDSERFIASSIAWTLVIIPAAASLIIYGRHDTVRALFELLPSAAAYIISLKHSRLTPAQIMNKATLITGITTIVICLELPLIISRLDYLRPVFFVVSYFTIFAFLIVKNQEDIDSHIFRKKHIDKSVLPKNLRRFNAMSTIVIFALTMLLFNFKTVVMYIMDIAKKIIQLVFSFFMWILDKFIKDVPPQAEYMQNSMSFTSGQRPTPLFNFISNVLMYFVILYAAYKLLSIIVIRIPAAFARFLSMLRNLFKINSGIGDAESSDFVDTSETVLPDVRNMAAKTKKRKTRAKKLDKITDPVEKVRYMYGNILGMLLLHGVNPNHSDTTAEILSKAAGSVEVQEGLSPFTVIYDQVRYGEILPDGDMLVRAEKYYINIGDESKR